MLIPILYTTSNQQEHRKNTSTKPNKSITVRGANSQITSYKIVYVGERREEMNKIAPLEEILN